MRNCLSRFFCLDCISPKTRFFIWRKKKLKIGFGAPILGVFCVFGYKFEKDAQNQRAKANFQLFSSDQKSIFSRMQCEQKIRTSGFVLRTSRRIQRTYCNGKISTFLNQCQSTESWESSLDIMSLRGLIVKAFRIGFFAIL